MSKLLKCQYFFTQNIVFSLQSWFAMQFLYISLVQKKTKGKVKLCKTQINFQFLNNSVQDNIPSWQSKYFYQLIRKCGSVNGPEAWGVLSSSAS